MSKSFGDTISVLGRIYPQKITRIISLYTVDPDQINRDNKDLEQKLKEISDEIKTNRELLYFTFLSNTISMPDSITSAKIKKVLYKQLSTVPYKDIKWIQNYDTNKCISYQALISEVISNDDEQYIYFITQVVNKTFPDLFVKIEDEETEDGIVLLIRVFWI